MQNSVEEVASAFTLAEPSLPCVPADIDAPNFLRALDAMLSAEHLRGRLRLPDFSRCSSVGVFSDYSDKRAGQGDYNTYTFLMVNLGAVSSVCADLNRIRLRHGLDPTHELSFKRLDHGPTRRALPDLLECADNLPGLLVNVLVPKSLPSLFATTRKAARQLLVDAGFDGLPQPVAEATLRVTHLIAYFVRLLCLPHHKLFWMTDRDDMLANERRAKQFWTIADRAIHALSPNSFSTVGFAQQFPEVVTAFDVRFMLSIADLFAGATGPALTTLTTRKPVEFRDAALPIVESLGRESIFLKKLTTTVAFDASNTAQVGFVSWQLR